MRLRTLFALSLLPVFFGLGWWGSYRFRDYFQKNDGPTFSVIRGVDQRVDVIGISASSSKNEGVSSSGGAFDISTNRENLEKTIRGVPFSFLKQVYLERQDQEWAKANLRYNRIPPEDEQAQKKQTEELFNLFQKNSSGASYFTTTTDWTLRGGKRVPVTLLVQLYSSRTTDGSSTQGEAALATQGSELCYTASVYFGITTTDGARYASEGTGSCLRWPTVRDGKPYVLFDNYAKQVTHLFDKVSAPLPGFGSDLDSEPEWYDSNNQRWTPLAHLRWDPITREDYSRIESDLQLETAHN